MIPPRWLRLCLMALAIGLVHHVAAKSESPHRVAQMNAPEIEHALQVGISTGRFDRCQATDLWKQCSIVQDLNRHRIETNPQTSGLTSRIFAVLFPGSPAINALLATLYISGPPSQYKSNRLSTTRLNVIRFPPCPMSS